MSTWGRKRSSATRTEHRRQHPPRRCNQCGNTGKLFQDHIVALAQGGLDVVDNMQWLCETCHGPKTEAERRAGWERKQRYRNQRRHLPQHPHPGDH